MNNPLRFLDPDGRVVRNAQGLIRFSPRIRNFEAIGGTESTSLIRGPVGEITANDGKTKMTVLLATHVREQDPITNQWGWKK